MKLTINRIKARTLISTLIVVFFYVANFLRMLEITTLPYIIILLAAGVMGWWWFLCSSYRKFVILVTFLIMITSTLLNGVFIGNVSAGDIINVVCFFGVLFSIYTSNMSTKIVNMMMILCLAFFIASWIRNPLEPQVFSSSRNYNSIIMLLIACLYYPMFENRKQIIRIWPAILIFLISVWSMGRGGILASVVLLLGILYLRFKNLINRSKYRKVIWCLLGLLTSLLLIVLLFYDGVADRILDNTIFKLGKFSYADNSFGDSPRAVLWNEYLSKTASSLEYTLMGAPLDQCMHINAFENNTHNSFIQLHAYSGVFSSIIVLFLIIRAELYYWKNNLSLHFLMMNIIILRAMTDKFIFYQYGFPIFMYFLFYQETRTVALNKVQTPAVKNI